MPCLRTISLSRINAVSRSMQRMLELLESEAMEKDTEVLNKFYENVRMNVGDIDNLEGKQMLIKKSV